MKTQSILGFEVNANSAEVINGHISKVLDGDARKCVWLACLNPHSYAISKKDFAFEAALRSADWLIADGVGVVIAGRILTRPIPERVTGTDVFNGVMTELEKRHGSVFFLGSTEKTLEMICAKLAVDYPNVKLAGTYSPSFRPTYNIRELDHMVNAINEAHADVLWVGMTAPKQEKWINDLRGRLDVKFAGAIGAVFDFYVGQIQRSHPVFQRLGLEWLPRLLKQPGRLWRRMFVSAPVFLIDVLRQRVAGYRN